VLRLSPVALDAVVPLGVELVARSAARGRGDPHPNAWWLGYRDRMMNGYFSAGDWTLKEGHAEGDFVRA